MEMEYEKLTEEQALDILNEISAENAEDISQLDSTISQIDLIDEEEDRAAVEIQSESSNTKRNKNATILPAFIALSHKESGLSTREIIRRRKMEVKRILTLTNNSYVLTKTLTQEHMQAIIPFMTQAFNKSLGRIKRSINNRIARLINPLIPNVLKVARTVCGRRAFVEHPGFIWECSSNYDSFKIWVTPDIPYYFEQHSEMRILHEQYPAEKLRSVDALIDKYLQSIVRLRKRQARLASKLTYVVTYEDLINFNIECAEYLIEQIVGPLSVLEAQVKEEFDNKPKKGRGKKA